MKKRNIFIIIGCLVAFITLAFVATNRLSSLPAQDQLRSRVLELMPLRAEISNIPDSYITGPESKNLETIKTELRHKIEHVWAPEKVEENLTTMLRAVELAKSTPNYKEYENASYLLESWQNADISSDGKSAHVVLTGRIQFHYSDKVVSDTLDRSEIDLVKIQGQWFLEKTKATFIE